MQPLILQHFALPQHSPHPLITRVKLQLALAPAVALDDAAAAIEEASLHVAAAAEPVCVCARVCVCVSRSAHVAWRDVHSAHNILTSQLTVYENSTA
jgi:hypothetical protein